MYAPLTTGCTVVTSDQLAGCVDLFSVEAVRIHSSEVCSLREDHDHDHDDL